MKSENTKLEDLGWDDFFQTKKAELNLDDFSVARVIVEHKGAYQVKNDKGEFLAKLTGKQMFEAGSREDFPAVGDWVAITELENQQAVISAVLPRKSVIERKTGDKNRAGDKSDVQIIAANVDVAFIVQAVGRDFNLNRFERYLAVVKESNIKPVAIINKTDLISATEAGSKQQEAKERLGDVDVVLISAKAGEGIGKLKKFIKEKQTCCFLGSSGVGKSSLINRLLDEAAIETGDISLHSDRGKHVTTKREMYFLENGGIVIDNPGTREIGLTDAGSGVDSSFDEIARLAKECKYSDCTHVHEPGCAVLATVEDGDLDKERHSNYLDLKKEAEFHGMSKHEKRDKNRQFGKFMKNAKKDFRRIGKKDY